MNHDHNRMVRECGTCYVCQAAPQVEADRLKVDPTHQPDTRHAAQEASP